jgi:CRISPR-associated helicase Cas3/CRISPR-associated endonuclease Cas3-HD
MADADSRQYYAHTPNKRGEWHVLKDHLQMVAEDAAGFASAFQCGEEAYFAGILHDLGKYGELFQRRLQGKERGIDHWTSGAWTALRDFRIIAATAAIQGHHIGLQRLSPVAMRAVCTDHTTRGLRLSEIAPEPLLERFVADGLSVYPPSKQHYVPWRETASAMLDVRMLYSALVDADFLDTERHFKQGVVGWERPKAPELEPSRAYEALLEHMNAVRASSRSSEEVKGLRESLFSSCVQAAQGKAGVWTLTAPTGSGKTLAMLAFALRHAMENNLRRIVVVIPYLSIIEQTAAIYREIFEPIFGDNYVLEQHSLSEPRGASADNEIADDQYLSQNWDAPVIVTTSVQMLESLFSNRPSACRKLHRLAESVILFDEVQTLPQHLAVATLATISHLAERYRSSVVFSTATQPAFTELSPHVQELQDSPTGWHPTEIVGEPSRLFQQAVRTKMTWPELNERLSWNELSDRLSDYSQVLCVVNLKRHAQELMEKMRQTEGLLHLSTNMCPMHRRNVLGEAKQRLDTGQPCRMISTSCIEAGVDIDFSHVFRAMADVVSIAQAAGRCNRNGLLEVGEVRVFIPEEEKYPSGGYRQGADISKMMLRDLGEPGMDIKAPALFLDYYRRMYALAKTFDSTKSKCLHEAINRQDFVDVARMYRIIDQNTINILVPYDLDAYGTLVGEVRAEGLTANWVKRARPYAVSIYRPQGDIFPQWLESVMTKKGEPTSDWFIYLNEEDYKNDVGLVLPEPTGYYIG